MESLVPSPALDAMGRDGKNVNSHVNVSKCQYLNKDHVENYVTEKVVGSGRQDATLLIYVSSHLLLPTCVYYDHQS